MSPSDAMTTADVTVIGGGIAGVGVAARLAEADPSLSIILLEGEDRLAFHSTGRSAAMYIRNYGPPAIRALNILSEDVFFNPEGFSDQPLLSPRGEMTLDTGRSDAFEAYMEGSSGLEIISGDEARKIVPVLKPDYVRQAAYEADASDIDVHQLMSSYVTLAKRHGVRIETAHPVSAITKDGQGWRITAGDAVISTAIVVNAAGAWADHIAAMAGISTVGLVPKRRSAALIPQPDGIDFSRWPLTVPAEEDWYFRPDSGRLMVSPADEDPVEAMDIYPDDMVLAEGLHRFEEATTMTITRVEHQWAGLRSFVADKNPVLGFAPDGDGFFWLAGQGGYGIQTSPAMSALAAALVSGQSHSADDALINMLKPERFVL